MPDSKLVYSSEGAAKPTQKESKGDFDPSEITLSLRLEKKGRGGKTVSVIYELPEAPAYFQKLTKRLKSRCGTGGTFKGTQIEIQGDNRDRLEEELKQAGFKVKRTGG